MIKAKDMLYVLAQECHFLGLSNLGVWSEYEYSAVS